MLSTDPLVKILRSYGAFKSALAATIDDPAPLESDVRYSRYSAPSRPKKLRPLPAGAPESVVLAAVRVAMLDIALRPTQPARAAFAPVTAFDNNDYSLCFYIGNFNQLIAALFSPTLDGSTSLGSFG